MLYQCNIFRADEVLLATSPESTGEKKIKSTSIRENDMCCHEIADSSHIGRVAENSVRKYLVTSPQTCEGMKETISYEDKECLTAQKSSSNQKKTEQKHGSASCESSKENDGKCSLV